MKTFPCVVSLEEARQVNGVSRLLQKHRNLPFHLRHKCLYSRPPAYIEYCEIYAFFPITERSHGLCHTLIALEILHQTESIIKCRHVSVLLIHALSFLKVLK